VEMTAVEPPWNTLRILPQFHRTATATLFQYKMSLKGEVDSNTR
jgi:hypothetical protein